ncbi:RHS repeat-associated core domain-containing protein [Salmonella enterica]
MAFQLAGTDMHGSPLLSLQSNTVTMFSWGPYGGCTPRTGASRSLPGFNGERQDPLTSASHLGNGYRAYSPFLRRFTCPDNESPFGEGGINAYAYCNGDPVNQTDPSGHGPLTWLLGAGMRIGLRILLDGTMAKGMLKALRIAGKVETHLERLASVSTGLSAAIMAKKDPQMAARLGWASFGLGLPDALTGAKKLFQHQYKLLSGLHELIAGNKNQLALHSYGCKPMYYEFSKKMDSAGRYRLKGTYGYSDNFRDIGEEALLLHGTSKGSLLVSYGEVELSVHRFFGTEIKYTRSKANLKYMLLTPAELVEAMRDDLGINLADPDKRNKPIHLISCYAKRGAAQALADATGREVYAYSTHITRSQGLERLEYADYKIKAGYRMYDPRRLFLGGHKPNRRSFFPKVPTL